jgi:hypothetical protein
MHRATGVFLATALIAATLHGLPLAHATPQPAPAGGPIARFGEYNPDSTQTFSYLLWTRILQTVLERGTGRAGIDYGAINSAGRAALDSMVADMTNIRVSTLDRDEQLAYWLNLYNAATLRAMLDQFSALGNTSHDFASRRPGQRERFNVKRAYTGDDSPWTTRNLVVEGEALSLNDIEHRILYAHWEPELVMYGLYCPLRGCPAMPAQPFQGGLVRSQLAEAAAQFAADKDHVRIRRDEAKVSELYRWHAAAFGGEAGVVAHLRALAEPSGRPELAAVTRIDGYDFDWTLDGTAPPVDSDLPRGQMNRGAGAGGSFDY